MVSFTLDELHESLGSTMPRSRVEGLVDLLSAPADEIEGEPSPLALTPLAIRPEDDPGVVEGRW